MKCKTVASTVVSVLLVSSASIAQDKNEENRQKIRKRVMAL
jgi:cytochrome c556